MATTISNSIDILDNGKLLIGDSDDLQIYHDGSHSYIKDTGTGDLYIEASDDLILKATDSNELIRCNANSSVQLYHNGSEKLETTSTGIDVTGNVIGTSNLVVSTNSNSNSMYVGGGSFSPSQLWLESTSHTLFKTAGSERMRIDSSGTVLINGTTSPTTRTGGNGSTGDCVIEAPALGDNALTLKAPISHGAGVGTDIVGLNFAANNYYTSSGKSGTYYQIMAENGNGTYSDRGQLRFTPGYGGTIASGQLSNSIVFSYDGHVGIGTDDPQQLLHIHNSSGDWGAEAVLTGRLSAGVPKAEVAFKRGTSGDGAMLVLRSSNSSGGLIDAVTIKDGTGNVGIGMDNPQEKLHVEVPGSSTTYVTGIKINNDSDLSGENVGISFGSPSWGDGAAVYAKDLSDDGKCDLGFAVRVSGAPTEKLKITADGIQINGDIEIGVHPFAITGESGSDRLTIHENTGAVWIDGSCSAASFIDRTPYPETLQLAYDVINSHQKLPADEYKADDQSKQLDHTKLHEYVSITTPATLWTENHNLPEGVSVGDVKKEEEKSRNMSGVISCLVEVIRDLSTKNEELTTRIETLENA